jgi:hypothetical protein
MQFSIPGDPNNPQDALEQVSVGAVMWPYEPANASALTDDQP